MTSLQPTIGIEIELPWRAMLHRVDEEAAILLQSARHGFKGLQEPERRRVQQGFDLVDLVYKDRVAGVFDDQIKRHKDGYAEFAFRPQDTHEKLSEQVAGLYEKGVFVAGESYPLHVTLGGIPATHGSWLILMAAELSGGTTPERITQVNTWSQKGIAGVKPRKPFELEGGQRVGVELRTLCVESADGLAETLKIIQIAGSIMLAKLAGAQAASEKWRELRRVMMAGVEKVGIDATARWRNPQHDIRPWRSLGLALENEVWATETKSKIHSTLLD